jgi:hypothetical protein
MYRPLRALSFLALLLLSAVLIGCGSGGSISGSGPGLGNGSNNAMLQGQYAFALSGQDTNGPFFAVGSFTADGQGHLGGNEDVIRSTLQTGNSGARFAGTYAVGPDGRGNAVLGLQPGCPNWQFTMLSHAHALLTCLNTNITGSGTIDLQDPRAFSTAALKGNYVFSASGLGISGAPAVAAGSWTSDGSGALSGEMDINDLGSTSLFPNTPLTAGSYSVSSNGRGTASISSNYASQNFVFYVVNATDFKFTETDSAPALSGEALSGAPFTGASFNGTYAFTMGGSDSNGFPLAFGGLIPADGSGNIASGVLDANDGGSSSIGNAVTGTYTVTSGRGFTTLNASIGSIPMAFYKAANGNIQLVSLGGSVGGAAFAVGGMAKAQAGGPFGTHSVNGNYAVNFSGTNLGSAFTPTGEEDISGQLISDGAGNLAGILDVNNSGSIFQGVPLSASTYTMTASGRGTASINAGTGTFAMQTYQIDANTVLFLDVDNNRIMTGIAEKQQF